ncbi:hypothetical protein CBF93_04840, partial [Limosilactobacillus reuteri]|uniref:glycosyltransferase family 2 protein n=1 Tax=Limosilactobacillus reuteri TaxID=1598 RepID=UPI000BC949C1
SLVEQQTKYTFSIIVVNDGSTDHTATMLANWAKRFSNIQVINCPHGGVARARNIGLNASNARYISFVDADDYVEKDYVESLMNPASKYNADIVEGSYQTINDAERFVNETDLKANAFQALHLYLINNIRCRRRRTCISRLQRYHKTKTKRNNKNRKKIQQI